jgi:hypothetical protein
MDAPRNTGRVPMIDFTGAMVPYIQNGPTNIVLEEIDTEA